MDVKTDALNYYGATKKYQLQFAPLQEDLQADVVIVGGGSSAINTALELAERGVTDVIVLEARHLGYGGSGRSGGQVMAGIGHDIDAVKKHAGPQGLKTLFAIAHLGAGIIRERIKKYQIDADFVPGYGYLAYNTRQLRTLQQWEKAFKRAAPDEEIALYTGSEVQQVVGSPVYCGALKHMGGGQIHALNMLLGCANAAASLGVKIFESSPVVEVEYGKTIRVRTAMGSVRAAKMLWACRDNIEPELASGAPNTYCYQISTAPLADELIERICPLRGAFSDIRPAINHYRITKDNRLIFGSTTRFVAYTPRDVANWNRTLMTQIFPCLKNAKIDFAWGGAVSGGGPFPQIGTLRERGNVFYVRDHSGFGMTPSHVISRILAQGILGDPGHCRQFSGAPFVNLPGQTPARDRRLPHAGRL